MTDIKKIFDDIYLAVVVAESHKVMAKFYAQFPNKPNFSYENKPIPQQFVDKIHNEFVRNILNNHLDVLKNGYGARSYPLYLIATEWKRHFSSDLTDAAIIKDILTNIYNELFPVSFQYNSYSCNNNEIEFYQSELASAYFFGQTTSGESLWSLNNDTLISLYLDWIYDQIMNCHQCKPDFPFKLEISAYTEERQIAAQIREKIISKYNNYPRLDESLDNPFVNGNTIYIKCLNI